MIALWPNVLAAERLHGDDTTVPVLAKGKTVTGRCWTYVRDDRPFGGRAPPAAVFFYSRDRSGGHPRQHLAVWTGVLQADAYGGYGKLYDAGRQPGSIAEAACWAHARRKFFMLADIEANARRKAQRRTTAPVSPIALEAVRRIDALFEIERSINGLPADRRLAVRRERAAPLVAALEAWMREERRKLSRHSDVAGPTRNPGGTRRWGFPQFPQAFCQSPTARRGDGTTQHWACPSRGEALSK